MLCQVRSVSHQKTDTAQFRDADQGPREFWNLGAEREGAGEGGGRSRDEVSLVQDGGACVLLSCGHQDRTNTKLCQEG